MTSPLEQFTSAQRPRQSPEPIRPPLLQASGSQLHDYDSAAEFDAAKTLEAGARRKGLGVVGWPLPLRFVVSKGEVIRRAAGAKYVVFSIDVVYHVKPRHLNQKEARNTSSSSSAPLPSDPCSQEPAHDGRTALNSDVFCQLDNTTEPNKQRQLNRSDSSKRSSSDAFSFDGSSQVWKSTATASVPPGLPTAPKSAHSNGVQPRGPTRPQPDNYSSPPRQPLAGLIVRTGSGGHKLFNPPPPLPPRHYKWTVIKRYSECEALHTLLKQRFARVPYFPPKTIFRILDSAHIENRREKINAYFASIKESREIMCSWEVRSFFELPPHVEEADRKARMAVFGHQNYKPVKTAETRDEEFGVQYAFFDDAMGLLTVASSDSSSSSYSTSGSLAIKQRLPWEPAINLYPAGRISFWRVSDCFDVSVGTGTPIAKKTSLAASKLFTTMFRTVTHGLAGGAFYLFVAFAEERTVLLKIRREEQGDSPSKMCGEALLSPTSLGSTAATPPPSNDVSGKHKPLPGDANQPVVAAPSDSASARTANSTVQTSLQQPPQRPPATATTVSSVPNPFAPISSYIMSHLKSLPFASGSFESPNEKSCNCSDGADLCGQLDLGPEFEVQCAVLPYAAGANALAFSPSTSTLFAGRRDGKLFGIDVESVGSSTPLKLQDRKYRTYVVEQSPINCLRVAETTTVSFLYAGCDNGKVYVYDSSSSELLATLSDDAGTSAIGVSISFNYRVNYMAATFAERVLNKAAKVSEVEPANQVVVEDAKKVLGSREAPSREAKESQGDDSEPLEYALLAAVNADNMLSCWETCGISLDTHKLTPSRALRVIPTPNKITAVELTSDMSFIFCGDGSGNVTILKIVRSRSFPIYVWSAHSSAVTSLRWLEPKSLLLTSSRDGYVRLWSFPHVYDS